MYHGNSLGPEGNDYATVHLSVEEGNVVLRTVLTEYGTGAPSGLLQLAGEILGLPVDRIQLGAADTSLCQDSGPTVASRTILMGGRATQQAARQLRDTLGRIAGELLGGNPAVLEFANGRVTLPTSGRSVSIDEVFAEAKRRGIELHETGTYMAPRCEWDHDTGQGTLYLQYTYGAVVAEVEVDPELGSINVIRLTTAYDVGKAINPLSLIGQIEGGTVQGLGYAIMEELVHRDGVVQNPNLGDYYIPTSLDLPEIETIIVEHPGPIGPYGAKAMGEPPIVLPAPAIVNAIAQATGIRVRDLPVTPEKLLLGLRRAAAEQRSAARQP
jgi:CO/xanthine dehydrogenase Mo-binding subunit